MPRYDFKTGRRSGDAGSVSLPAGAVLLIDSLHGLFPEMTVSLPEEMKFRLYVETLSQARAADGRYIRWADVRMLRRVVRDMQFRNYSPRSTIRHWPLVRRVGAALHRAGAAPRSRPGQQLPSVRASRHEGAASSRRLAPLIDEFKAGAGRTRKPTRGRHRVQALFDQVPAVTDEELVPRPFAAARVHRRKRVRVSLTRRPGRPP